MGGKLLQSFLSNANHYVGDFSGMGIGINRFWLRTVKELCGEGRVNKDDP